MTGWEYYAVVLLVYAGTNIISAWGLNLEFGVAGVPNFAFIVLVAAGGYTYAMLTLGPDTALGGFQQYLVGARLPAVVAILCAMGVAAILGALIGLTGLKRLRADYQGMVMLVVSITATSIVVADRGLVNGSQGLALIPNPLHALTQSAESWTYGAVVAGLVFVVYLVLRRFTTGPFGRLLRAMRDNEETALSVGKNVVGLQLLVQAIGGALAGLSGALLVGFIGAWSPNAWMFIETMSLLAAIVVGGIGNNWGVVAGTVLVLTVFLQGVTFIPPVAGNPDLIPELGWTTVGLLTIGFIFLRPAGLFPDRRPKAPPSFARSAHPTARGAAANGSTASAEFLRELVALGPATTEGLDHVDDAILVADGVRREFGGVRAVDGASFTVGRGTITGLIGPNGAGKSTTLGILSGFIRPTAGTILFEGRNVAHVGPHRRARAGLVRTFQASREFRSLTTLENLVVAAPRARSESTRGVFGGRRYWGGEEREITERAYELLALFGVESKASELAGNLSGGQKRLLEVMRAVMARPKLLLLDEPTAGLSPALVERLGDALIKLREDGLTIVLVEHELETVNRLCDTVIVMVDGKVFAQGTMADLRVRKDVQEAYIAG